MKLEILSSRENKLLQRQEIEAALESSKTPSRKETIAFLAAKTNAKENLVVIDSIKHEFGQHRSLIRAKVYSDEGTLKRLEASYLTKRTEPKKKEKQEPKAAEKKAEKSGEETAEAAEKRKSKAEAGSEGEEATGKGSKPEGKKQDAQTGAAGKMEKSDAAEQGNAKEAEGKKEGT